MIIEKRSSSMDVKERVVVVTGAGRGIGAAMCRTFAKAEARLIVVSDRDEESARIVAEQIGAQAIFNRCDVANEEF
jgi:NAD(P)-dependent dehydrogenase (short-subunit alcohol dehydrogenase family)